MADQTAQQTATILLGRMLRLYRLMRQFRVHGLVSVGRLMHPSLGDLVAEVPALPPHARGCTDEPSIVENKRIHPACFARWWEEGPPWYAPPEPTWLAAAEKVWEDTGSFGGPLPEHMTPWGRFVFGDALPWAGDDAETRLNATLGAWLVDVWCPFVGSLTKMAREDGDGEGEIQ